MIFECRVGPGRLLVSAIDLETDDAGAGLRQLRRSLLDYMATPKFLPSATLTPAQAADLWQTGDSRGSAPASRTLDPDLDDGSGRKLKKS